jgi:5,10-methylenetetrahydromethanopterin reductase
VRFGVIYQSFDPPATFLEYVRQVEDGGFDELWVCDSSLHARDVIAYLTLAALNTTRLMLGVSVFQPYTRHPAIDVNAMLTLNEISGGRALMAVGAGDRPQLELGFKPAPVRLVREMIEASRQLISGQSVAMQTDTFVLEQARVRHNVPASLPIYVACSGPKMLQMAGEVADGVVMMSGATTDTISYALANVLQGAKNAGRCVEDIDIAWGAATVVADVQREALDQTRIMAAWFANHSVRYAERVGVSAELVAAMRGQDPGSNLHEARSAAALAPDDVVDQLALAGPPSHIIERIGAARALGIKHFDLFLIGPNKRRTLQRFSDEVMPAFR